MAISAEMVRVLRERTGAGMMECKRALEAVSGDLDQAADKLRKDGQAKADKKADRVAAEGRVGVLLSPDAKRGVIIEINSETDFVSRDANFVDYSQSVLKLALENGVESVDALSSSRFSNGVSVDERRLELVSKIGENIQIRRLKQFSSKGHLFSYLHGNHIGVVVELDVDQSDLGRDIAMHIAACKPMVIAPEDVSKEYLEKEREIFIAQAASSGKPQDIIEKMVAGRLKKCVDEVCLLGQPFVKEPDMTVGALLSKHRARVISFARYEVGEGIEKIVEDFREAVMSQIQGS